MSKHEYFEQLGALALIGQITFDEGKELDIHLAECAVCREAHADFGRILKRELPQATPRRWRLKGSLPLPAADGEIQDRFIARARAEGIGLSSQVQQHYPQPQINSWNSFKWQYAVGTAAVVILVTLGVLASKTYNRTAPRSVTADPQVAELKKERESLRAKLSEANQLIEWSSTDLARLKKENSASTESIQVIEKQLGQARREAVQLSAALEQAQTQNAGLSNRNQQDQSVIADLRGQVDMERRAIAEGHKSADAQQARLAELEDSLRVASEKVERERQLSGVSRDVRILMGARNLHIIDVHDIDGGGRSSKPFGRVFYAEGRSLVFYAFDLPNGRFSPAKYSFMAWGQNEATPQSPRRLGTFEVDDHEQRRWVLKVDNPKLLSGIDSVFVTAEALGDPYQPRGRKIIYAYLAGQPNHP